MARQPVEVEIVAAAAFRRPTQEIGVGEEATEQVGQEVAAARPVAVFIIGQSAVALYPAVHQAVAGAGVVAGTGGGADVADVGDAANVHQRGGAVAKQTALEQRCQRRALPARGEVAAAEIGDGINACAFGNQRRILQLDGIGRAVVGIVAQCLPVRADGGDIAHRKPGFFQQGDNGFSARRSVLPGSDRSAVQFIVARLAQRLQRGAQRGRHGLLVVGEVVVALALFADKGDINAVQAGAGHDAEVIAGSSHGSVR